MGARLIHLSKFVTLIEVMIYFCLGGLISLVKCCLMVEKRKTNVMVDFG